jgi:hypothetical protein
MTALKLRLADCPSGAYPWECDLDGLCANLFISVDYGFCGCWLWDQAPAAEPSSSAIQNQWLNLAASSIAKLK